MSTYDARIEAAERDMNAADEDLGLRAYELSPEIWELIKKYINSAVILQTLLAAKATEK
jgi:hypothetical protein